jgi:hypothetical protein
MRNINTDPLQMRQIKVTGGKKNQNFFLTNLRIDLIRNVTDRGGP